MLQCDKCVYCVFGGAKTVTDKLLSRRNCKDSILIRVWTLFPKYDVVYNVLDRFLGKCLEGDLVDAITHIIGAANFHSTLLIRSTAKK